MYTIDLCDHSVWYTINLGDHSVWRRHVDHLRQTGLIDNTLKSQQHELTLPTHLSDRTVIIDVQISMQPLLSSQSLDQSKAGVDKPDLPNPELTTDNATSVCDKRYPLNRKQESTSQTKIFMTVDIFNKSY